MAYTNTVFNQLLTFIPKQHFNTFVGQHKADRYVKKLTTWNQFIALMYAQATGKESLRDIQTGLSMYEEKWSHLDIKSVARSSISYANKNRNYKIFEELFYELLSQCKDIAQEKSFTFSNHLYSLDATTIKLCLSMFDWAKYTRTKGALKLHTLLDNKTMMPTVVVSSNGKKGDITAAKEMNITTTLENGSIVVFDRAYVDYRWWRDLDDNNIFFVSRTKNNSCITVMGQHKDPEDINILSDNKVIIGEHCGYEKYSKVTKFTYILHSLIKWAHHENTKQLPGS
jgi:hypothetical protein